MKQTDALREALGLLKRELGGIRGALERIEEGLEQALDASVEMESDRLEPETIFNDSPESPSFPIDSIHPDHDDGGQPPSAVPIVPPPSQEMRVDDEHWPLAATAQESSSSSAIDALLGGLFSAPSPSKDEEKPESASSSSFIPHPSSLSDTPEPVASAKAETPPPLDDELEQLLAATSSRAKTVDRASAPEKKPDAAPPSSSPAIDALLGGLFHSNTPVPPVEAVPSSSDPDRFDLSVNALEDMLGGGKTGR